MEVLEKNATLTIDKSDLYEFEAKALDSLEVKVLSGVKAEILISYNDDIKANRTFNLSENASLNILHINNCRNEEIKDVYNLEAYSSLKCGYYELNDGDVDLNCKVNLNGAESFSEILSSAITNDNKKKIDIECIHNIRNTTSKMKNYEISNENANYEVIASGTIKKGSKQANSTQSTRVLTTSDNQKSSVTPLLIIDENDVVASHANTVGQMNEEHLYYLMSRGLSLSEATGLLTLSYLLPLSEIIEDKEISERIENTIRSKVGL